MPLVTLASFLVLLGAFGWSLVLLRHLRDWRVGFLTLMLTLMTAHQGITVVLHWESGIQFPGPHAAAELPALAVSIMVLFGVVVVGRILLGRGRTEAALAESQLKYRNLVETGNNFVYRVDREGRLTYVNEMVTGILGYKPEEVLGKTLVDYVPPERRDRARRAFTNRIAAGEPLFDWEAIVLDAAGRPRWLNTNFIPERDAAGHITGLTGTAQDITERKRMETALREGEAQFRSTFHQAAVGMSIIGSDGRFRDVNQRYADIVGYTRDELLAMPFIDLLVQEDPIAVENLGPDAGPDATTSFMWEVHLRRKDGEIILCRVTRTIPFDDEGKPLHSLGVLEDITAQKRAQDALEASERSLARAQEITHIGNWEWHRATDRVDGSDELRRIFGLPLDGSPIHMADLGALVHPDDLGEFGDRLARAFHGNYGTGLEFRINRPDGEDRVLFALAESASERAGEIVALSGIVQDNTERKAVERAHRALEVQLLQAQKMEAVGTLAGGIAHDFNNLLTGILGGIQLSLLDLEPDSPTAEGLRQAEAAAERAAELTQQLLTLSRRREPEMGPVDINEVVNRTARLLQRSISETVEVRLVLDPAIPTIRADAGQLEQALLNLGINARDAMPDGGRLTFETTTVDVDASTAELHPDAKPGRYVCLTVADSGPGIPADVLEHIFEPFYTTKEPGRGTGLGLAMVYGCMRAHDGWIDAAGEHGATFRLFIPLIPIDAARDTELISEVPRGTETVLLVDDQDAVLFLGRSLLERCGYRVIIAWDGEEALQRIAERGDEIAVVVTDLVMPRRGGRHLLSALRERGAQVPVILTSGYASGGRPSDMLREGFAAFVPKPFALMSLARAVRDVLDGGTGEPSDLP